MTLYSVKTNNVQAAEEKMSTIMCTVMPKQSGYIGYCFINNSTMYWLYNNYDAAASAMKIAKAVQIPCIEQIDIFDWDEDTDKIRLIQGEE